MSSTLQNLRLLITIATCNLNQWAMNFSGNYTRILAAIIEAKLLGVMFLLTSELSLSGYGCEDHFMEANTFQQCIDSLAKLLREAPRDICYVVGMPWIFRGVRYNVNVVCLNGQIILIRPKMYMANDGNYRELRWFTPWSSSRGVMTAELPPEFSATQTTAPFGHAIISFKGITFGIEACEELFTPQPPHIELAMNGCDVIVNSSGSHHQLRKLNTRFELIGDATKRCGGVYMYANQRGCDGGRLYYDGSSMIFENGKCVAQSDQFGIEEIQIITATLDINKVRTKRALMSSGSIQAASANIIPVINVDFCMVNNTLGLTAPLSQVHYNTPEEEISLGPSYWLWDYLRRSNAGGYFLPLSGGADSAATATIAHIMCVNVFNAIQKGDTKVLADLRRITKTPEFMPTSSQEIANRLLHTCYMGTANSSDATRNRAATLAREIGNYHRDALIDVVVRAIIWIFISYISEGTMRGVAPRFAKNGGTMSEDLALQNIQARIRMVFAYCLAQLLPWMRKRSQNTGDGFLIVLGSANVDESLRGYMTKYDCSSADLNPIGAFSKTDLKSFLLYAAAAYNLPALVGIVKAPPTAELRPMDHSTTQFGIEETWVPMNLTEIAEPLPALPPLVEDFSGSSGEHSQLDEADMGMSYAELSIYGKLRKNPIAPCDPFEMYLTLVDSGALGATLTPADVATKVKRFFYYFGINRHKMCTLTPSYHGDDYSPDDNRFDHRQFLYPPWDAFAQIDADVQRRMSLSAGGSS